MSKSTKYVRPSQGMSTSAQVAHYLKFCYDNRRGERIRFQEIAQVVNNLPKTPRSDHSKVKSIRVSTAHIRNSLRDDYKLGMHSNQDGILVLDNGDDVTRYEVVPRAQKLDRARRGMEAPLELAEKMGFSNTPAGLQMKRFAARARSADRALQRELPTTAEIRGLLTSGEED